MTGYEIIIGLEIHAQLRTKSKIFCGCSARFGAEPNTSTCPVCLGMPGSLPVINLKAIEYGILMALAVRAKIQPFCQFARKNYFYPDLPKGYQISQYDKPLARGGFISVRTNEKPRKIALTRIHLEEDAGKSFHKGHLTLLDFNRCGVPLLEIVTEPVIHSAQEAAAFMKKLRTTVRYLGICDGNMEEGSLRCDANLSLRPKGSAGLGTKVEIKNMNSFRGVQKALEYEIKRQSTLLKNGKEIVKETRLWDEENGLTHSMRGKEESSDYRYFPEPDLVPLAINPQWVKRLKTKLPELPDKKLKRFMEQYALSIQEAMILCESRELADYFEICVKHSKDPRLASNWIINELLRVLKHKENAIRKSPVPPQNLGELLVLIKAGEISGKMAKEIFQEMVNTGTSPKKIFKKRGGQIKDKKILTGYILQVISEHPEQVQQYRAGKEKLIGFFVGEVMKMTGGKANPQIVNEILKEKL